MLKLRSCNVLVQRCQIGRTLVSIIVLSTGAVVEAVAQTPPPPPASNIPIVTALIALVGALVTVGASGVLAWFAARNAIRSEHRKRQSELALKISELVSVQEPDKRNAAMRRFAIAIVKIVAPREHVERGKVYFIPMNSRITVGRSDENDIVLQDKENHLSRWHCGFIADQHSVWIDDYKSENGTKVRGEEVAEPRQLKSGDEIEIGPYKLHFRAIKENSILSQ